MTESLQNKKKITKMSKGSKKGRETIFYSSPQIIEHIIYAQPNLMLLISVF